MSIKRRGVARLSLTLILAFFIFLPGCNNNNKKSSTHYPFPETTITATPHDPSNEDFATFAFSCDQGSCQFECSMDGSGWSGCASGQAFQNLAEGSHTFEVRAVKHGKRDKTPAGFTWTIDLTAPDTLLTQTPSNPTNSQDADFEFVCDDIMACTFECQLDSGGWNPCSSPLTYNGLAEGAHAFDVRAIDEATNTDPTPASFIWTIDVTPPDTLITNHPADPTNATDAIFDFSCTESGCIFECQLDSSGWNSCSSGAIYSSLSGGSHLFEVRAIDSAGNIDSTPASYAWNINPPPDTIITSHPPDPTNSGSASFSFVCDQPPCTFECSLDSAGWSACSSAKIYGTESWTPTATIGAPSAREYYTAVWTGTEMIVWGGYYYNIGLAQYLNTGGKYNPVTDSWTATSLTYAPAGRRSHTAIWTGNAILIWGGGYGAGFFGDGSYYYPDTDSWTAISNTNAPTARQYHTAIWTGTEMIIWGGVGFSSNVNTGGRYSPSTDTWVSTSMMNAPTARQGHTAVWTGTEMIVWGGYNGLPFMSTGARYNPSSDSWIATTLINAPSARMLHAALWTGNEMLIWGGSNGSGLGDGKRYNPVSDSWINISTVNAPSPRFGMTSVWTGKVMIIWGGNKNGTTYLNAGGEYNTATDSWTATSMTNVPSVRGNHSAVFADNTMMIWGGYDGLYFHNDGGKYDLALSEGSHSFAVRAYDAALNVDPAPATYNWTIDITPPDTQITAQPYLLTNSTSASFSFTCTDANTPCTFECNRDSGGWQPCMTSITYNLLSEGPHEFQVQAIDAAGNVDPAPPDYSWTIDITPPDTTISSGPVDPNNQTSAQFAFDCAETGCVFECNLDSSGWEPCDTPVTYNLLLEGLHNFQVRAIDAAGNVDPTPAINNWTIDLTPADTQIIAQPELLTNSTSASFSFICIDAHTPCTFECKMDSGPFGACISPDNYTSLSEGSHTFYVRATDAVGNTDLSPASYIWTIDLTNPDTQITAQPAPLSNSSSASFSFACTDLHTPCTFQCSIDSGAFATCTSPANYSGLTETIHNFQVQATDAANNMDATPASFSWTIDLPPDTTVTSHPSDPNNSRSADFSFICDQPPCTFECNLDSAGWSACSSPQTYLTPWTEISTVNAPIERYNHTAVWTGSEMIIWGGGALTTAMNTGGRYNPATDTWVPTQATNAPSARYKHTAIWTGSEMIVWGGYSGSAYLSTGSRYSPGTDSWSAISNSNAPVVGRAGHIAIFTGSDMIVWGGWNPSLLDTGGIYNLGTNSWSATSTNNAPSPRRYQTAVWTGANMIVWGGFDVSDLNTGGGYIPGTNSWTATAITNAPSARRYHTAVWTGTKMIVWGGAYFDVSWHYLNSGGIYNPATDSWIPTSTTNAPAGRDCHAAVWTGEEMIVWGGFNGSYLDTGGRYNPTTDAWNATSATGAPGAREYPTAVWTGAEMIIWGGTDSSHKLNTGGRFNPAGNLSEGTHDFAVRAYDVALNVDSTPAIFNWTIDFTPPITFLTSAPTDPTSSPDAVFEFTCNETGCTFECNLDSTGWTTCSSPAQYLGLPPGDYVFSVRATDPAGNLELNPLIYPWTIQP